MPRANPEWGRVGSILSDPNAGFMGPSADSNLVPPEFDTPTDIDEPFDDDPTLDDMDPPNDDVDVLPKPDTDPPLEEGSTPTEPNLDPNQLNPPTPDDDDSTSARRWRNRPLRPRQQWR